MKNVGTTLQIDHWIKIAKVCEMVSQALWKSSDYKILVQLFYYIAYLWKTLRPKEKK